MNEKQIEKVRMYMFKNKITQKALAKKLGKSNIAINVVLQNKQNVRKGKVPELIWEWYISEVMKELKEL